MSLHRFAVTVGAADIAGVLHIPERGPGAGPSPCVIACHGMGASKDSDKYLLLGRELPAAGLAVARFDLDRKSTRLNSSHIQKSRMPSSA